jgi:site-specific recombinase XerD
MNKSVQDAQSQLPELALERAFELARHYARQSRSANTWRAYQSDWRLFEGWCRSLELASLPAAPETVAMFIAQEAAHGRNPSTLARRLAAIRLVHRGAGLVSPHDALAVTEVMRGIRRDWGRAPNRKAPAFDDDIKRMVDVVTPDSAKGRRDRALLLFGFAGAFRRSELVALEVRHLEYRDNGLKVTIEVSKTDQEGQGQVVAILRQPDSRYCPVQALEDWRTVGQIEAGPLFRRMNRGDKVTESRLTSQSIALIVKDVARKVGLDASRYAGHSLRRGFLSSAARKRASIFKMADQSRHRSLDVLRQYVKDEDLFDDHAGADLLRDES